VHSLPALANRVLNHALILAPAAAQTQRASVAGEVDTHVTQATIHSAHGERSAPKSCKRNSSGISETATYHASTSRLYRGRVGMSHGTPAIHANHDEPTKDNAKPITSTSFQ
jgi:hypothetical protein